MDKELVAIINNPQQKEILSVSWDTSGVCNYNCSYCDDQYHDGRAKFPPADNMIRFLEDLDRGQKRKIYLEIKGGEPTYWKELPYFLRYCAKKEWGACVVTNGSQKLEWWKENLELISDLNISIHQESVNIDEMIEKLKYIHPRRTAVVKYLMHPKMFEQCKKDLLKMKKEIPTLKVRAMYVCNPNSDNELFEYTEEQRQFVEDMTDSFVQNSGKKLLPRFKFDDRYTASLLFNDGDTEVMRAQKLKIEKNNEWSGWLCLAGIDRIHISVKGDIYRGQCQQGGKIGNINEGQWEIPNEPVVCQKQRCFCGSELLIEKWNPKKVSLI